MPEIETGRDGALGPSRPDAPLEQLAAKAAVQLSRAGVQVAIAETGTAGEVATSLASSPEGRALLTQERRYRTPEELAVGLRVSPAKVEAFGAVSAMVAAEAAAELIDTYEGGWGLVVIAPAGNPAGEPNVKSGEVPDGFVALGTPSATVIEHCPVDELVRVTFDLLIEQATRRLRHA